MKYLVAGSSVGGVSPDGNDVARWEDTGSGTLSATGTMSGDAGTEMGLLHSLAATSDELLVRFEHGLVQYRWSAESSSPLGLAGESAYPAYGPSPGLCGLDMTWEPPLIAMAVSGENPRVCINTLDAGTAEVTGSCVGNVYGKTADGYWTRFSRSSDQLRPLDALSVHAMQGDGTFRQVETFLVPFEYRQEPSAPMSLTVASQDLERPGRVLLLPRVQPGGTVFEGYSNGETPAAGVERDYFWWHLSDGGTGVVFR
jgi:hypothetical protein